MTGTVLLPKFFRVKQNVSASSLEKIGECVRQSLSRQISCSLVGKSVAIAVGSRGIANLPIVVRAAVEWLKEQRAEPFIVPAMGSHGGATATGQTAVLESLGIVASSISCEIRSS